MKIFLKRLITWIHQIVISINQFIQIMVSGPLYLVCGGDMNADETISSKVGRKSFEGKHWAIILEWVIDRLLYFYEGGNLGHCWMAIEDSAIREAARLKISLLHHNRKY
jgi:hypothetical protein